MRRRIPRIAMAAIAAAIGLGASRGDAQEPVAPACGPGPTMPPVGLRAHFGVARAERLLAQRNADDRLRGFERVAATHTLAALDLLEVASAATPDGVDPRAPRSGAAWSDARTLLVVVRGLASWTYREDACAALAALLRAPSAPFEVGRPGEEGPGLGALARKEAALALAASGKTAAIQALATIARTEGPGKAAALGALAAHPPSAPQFASMAPTTPAAVAMATAAGDLRSIDAVARASSAHDPALRAAAIVALAEDGDARVAKVAQASRRDSDARVRVAAVEALVRLGLPDAASAVVALLRDAATARGGLRLAAGVQDERVVLATAACAVASTDREMRAAAIAALGRQVSPRAIAALETLAADPTTQGDAVAAVARSPSGAAMRAIARWASSRSMRRMAARAYFVRSVERDERSVPLDALLASLAASADARDRAVGIEAQVGLRQCAVDRALADPDAGVRRAAALGALARWDDEARRAVLARLAVEPDAVTREVLAVGLVGSPAGGDDGIPTTRLRDRAEAGGADAPLATLALARRSGPEPAPTVDALLASEDPVLRAHAARGLGASPAPDAVGRLAQAYTWEADADVRRALVCALARRGGEDASAPARLDTLALASRLDPDAIVRWTARRALDGFSPESRAATARSVAWVRVVPAENAALPRDLTGAIVRSGDVAIPFAFDEDGYALVPEGAPGDALVRLASKLPTYKAPPR